MPFEWMYAFEHLPEGVTGRTWSVGDGAMTTIHSTNTNHQVATIDGRRVIRLQSTVNSVIISKALPGLTVMTVGCRIITSGTMTDRVVLDFMNGSAASLLNLYCNSTGNLEVRRGTTVLATSANTYQGAGSNQYYELAVVFDDTDGAFVLRAHGVSGTEEVSASGINNANAAVGAGCVRLDLRGSNSTSASMGYTDLYVRERADIESPGFHGPIELRLLDFEADVATDWTPDSGTDNYARISGAQREALASYIETNTLGDKDRYELGDLPAELNSIIAVIPVAVGLAPSGGAPQVAMRVHVGAGSVVGDPRMLGAGVGTIMSEPLLERPGGGGGSRANVNDAEPEFEAA
jgi:hypothetical protein